MDRRLTPYSGRVAHVSLSGVVNAPLTEGLQAQVTVPVANLCDAPDGARDRQLLLGEAVTVIDRDQGHVFVMSAKDGYCGWMAEGDLGQGPAPTHWVAAPGTHLYTEPQVQAREKMALSLGSRLAVVGSWGAWANTPHGFVPLRHLRALGDWADDPVTVAESLLGTPYLWGGEFALRAGLLGPGAVVDAKLRQALSGRQRHADVAGSASARERADEAGRPDLLEGPCGADRRPGPADPCQRAYNVGGL